MQGCLSGFARRPIAARLVLALGLSLAPLSAALADEAPVAANSDFEKTQRLEALRYRHMWIAFGAAWLIVCGFAWRTWRRAEQTEGELEVLKRRLTELENKHG